MNYLVQKYNYDLQLNTRMWERTAKYTLVIKTGLKMYHLMFHIIYEECFVYIYYIFLLEYIWNCMRSIITLFHAFYKGTTGKDEVLKHISFKTYSLLFHCN